MTITDDLATAVALACLTEDRTTSEQRALLRLAMRVEMERNATTSANLQARHHQPADLLCDTVERTHHENAVGPMGEKPVKLSPKDRAKIDRRRDTWEAERRAYVERGYR